MGSGVHKRSLEEVQERQIFSTFAKHRQVIHVEDVDSESKCSSAGKDSNSGCSIRRCLQAAIDEHCAAG